MEFEAILERLRLGEKYQKVTIINIHAHRKKRYTFSEITRSEKPEKICATIMNLLNKHLELNMEEMFYDSPIKEYEYS